MVVVVAAAGETEPEDQPAAACRRLVVLGLDAGAWDGCRVAGVLVHVGHLVQWRVVVGHQLHQLGGLAMPLFAVRASEI
jgi:hypothetical protein